MEALAFRLGEHGRSKRPPWARPSSEGTCHERPVPPRLHAGPSAKRPRRQHSAPRHYLQNSFRLSTEVVRLYPRLQAIDGERQIIRGVSIVDLTGHTPGHIGVRIEDAGQSLIMVSDMLFPVVHPVAADVNFLFEQDRTAAQAMRARFFPRAAAEGTLLAATHMAFPGLGRMVPDRGTLRWQPADWAFQT
jgi:glyoxylase-like metal-dependent hydrolase (beta-lactamase superfamily II)